MMYFGIGRNMEEPYLGTCVIGTNKEITAMFLMLPGMVMGLYQAHVPVRAPKGTWSVHKR